MNYFLTPAVVFFTSFAVGQELELIPLDKYMENNPVLEEATLYLSQRCAAV